MPDDGFQPIVLQTPDGARAKLCTHGAHLTSWRTADGIERLFTSSTTEYRPGVAIRGGVPIIFPQFAGLGALPKHGFARTVQWQRLAVPNESVDSALFRLQDSEITRAVWPQQFIADYAVALGKDALRMTLSIRNTGGQTWSFTAALHTYLRVQDITQVSIAGLQGLRYSDSAAGGVVNTDSAPSVRIVGEIDRIYFSTAQPITLCETAQRTLACRAEGFADTVIWNPGAQKGAALGDLEADGYRRMVCVEAAAIGEPIVLQPGTTWSGTQYLQLT